MNTSGMSFAHMSERERYWFGYLNRTAEDRGWSEKDSQPRSRNFFLPNSVSEDDVERLSVFLIDSLMVGLYKDEPIIAFRCYVQAAEYAAKLSALGEPTISYRDALMALREKVENSIRG